LRLHLVLPVSTRSALAGYILGIDRKQFEAKNADEMGICCKKLTAWNGSSWKVKTWLFDPTSQDVDGGGGKSEERQDKQHKCGATR
jgi:hypothetical protein